MAATAAVGPATPAVGAPVGGLGQFSSYPFSLGVASGDPLNDSVILWTRLAPQPLVIGSGMPNQPVPVHWQVADDEAFTTIVREGETFALPENNHSVHVDVRGLQPDRWYFYRFRCGSELSPVGRTRTLPALGASVASFTVSQMSCQNWQTGYFTAYRYMAQDGIDLGLHLGDYIYEGSITAVAPRDGATVPDEIRDPCQSVDQYRLRYSLYKTDPDLQAAHAAFPWAVIRDDHEVSNDYRGGVDQGPQQLARRAAGYKAWWENMPTRCAPPVGPDQRIYRRFAVGSLAQFDLLDSRQYRTADNDPLVSKLGNEQEAWLIDGINSYDTTWHLLAMGQQLGGVATSSPTRNRIYQAYYDRNVSPVILAGDLHWTLVSDALLALPDPTSPIVGTQFIGTSITSTGDGPGSQATKDGWLKYPWVKYADGYRGYLRTVITPTGLYSTQRDVQFVTQPNAPVWDAQRFYIAAGKPGVQLV
ncbi:alkaline phosphatase D family protein [Micromonospora yasonensis]|uniref:alkaline phosphatase D family protein n=1 Tax=Micromonospora yasonensis TaxID=1128667 RepID=UPI00223062D3|nr:alkaline phosphatase D family protein [Micromonospora yasonensis]MCW3840677.1 alkaline phosphatase D family protein [Micromonospora yasonensis]